MIFIHIQKMIFIINIDRCILTKSIIPPKYVFSSSAGLEYVRKDKMCNGSG